MSKQETRLMIIIWVQSLLAMLGSLYYSHFGDPFINIQIGEMFNPLNGFEPCNLCWFARILMYPIVAISSVALIRKSSEYVFAILPLVSLWVILEIYHYLLQKLPSIKTSFTCTGANPCDALSVNYFGFITIPLLCLIAFSVIAWATIRLLILKKQWASR